MWSVRMATRISSSTYPLGKEWHCGHSTGLDLDTQSCVGLAKLLNLYFRFLLCLKEIIMVFT